MKCHPHASLFSKIISLGSLEGAYRFQAASTITIINFCALKRVKGVWGLSIEAIEAVGDYDSPCDSMCVNVT